MVEEGQQGPHRQGPSLQVAVPRGGLILRHVHLALGVVPLHLLAEELRHIPGGDEGAALGDVGGHIHFHRFPIYISGLAVYRHDDGDTRPGQAHLSGGRIPAHVGPQPLGQGADRNHGAPILDLRRHVGGADDGLAVQIEAEVHLLIVIAGNHFPGPAVVPGQVLGQQGPVLRRDPRDVGSVVEVIHGHAQGGQRLIEDGSLPRGVAAKGAIQSVAPLAPHLQLVTQCVFLFAVELVPLAAGQTEGPSGRIEGTASFRRGRAPGVFRVFQAHQPGLVAHGR